MLTMFATIIVGAGSSTRLGQDKMFLEIDGIPVIIKSVLAFEHHPKISEIVLVVREKCRNKITMLLKAYNIVKVRTLVLGGTTRQQSVFSGIDVLSKEMTHVLIHDAARPFVTEKIISDCIDSVLEHGAAGAAIVSKDTVKIIDDDGKILTTPCRDHVYSMQTPQGFSLVLYRKCMDRVLQEGLDFTDDCQLFEASKMPVYISKGSYSNIKITTKEDLNV